ncbi:MAG: SsrA-binding protein [Rickettsiales bacterium]|nr:SsrA-binding protein [Rickettsiales bacterium]|tara:strand:+ start:258 stop:734 length:477 start_codon:yes stop_codon:yes gene_type:complete
MAKKKNKNSDGLIAQNKKGYFDYFIEETIETGIELKGTEVKSLRINGGSIKEAHADFKGEEIFLFNAHIPEYKQAGEHLQHEPTRARKLLLHKREIKRLIGLKQQKGYTLIATRMYFNSRGLVKVALGIAKGKKQHDKRQAIKDRDWNRRKAQVLKDY